MKVKIKQNVLEEALNKGAVAALLDDAQTDTSTMSLLVKSIKITCNKSFTIEGCTNLMAVKYTIPAKEENGITVDEEGCVLVPAKEFTNWVKAQSKDAQIGIVLSELATPEIINPLEGIEVEDGEDVSIKKIGSIKLVSKDSSKTARKWELDCYDPSQRKMVSFASEHKGTKHFEIKAKSLSTALSKIAFASLPKDYEHVLDSVSIQKYENDLFFATTDTKRCALYKIPPSDIDAIESDNPLLISVNLLDTASKISDEENKLSFYYNEDIERVFISQPNIEMRLASTEKGNIKKFPNIKMLLEKDYDLLAKTSRIGLNSDLISCALVNSSSALFSFTSDKSMLVIKAISDDSKYKPSVTKSEVNSLSINLKAVWGVTHLIDALKIIKDDMVELHIPDNKKSVKIKGEDDDGFLYFAMAINNPKYASDLDE